MTTTLSDRSRITLLAGALLLAFSPAPAAELYRYTIDAQKSLGPNTRFWQAAGHNFFFRSFNEATGQALLDRFQVSDACRYFRILYVFDNTTNYDKQAGGPIGGRVVAIDEQGNRHYDFHLLNRTLRELVKRGQKPILGFCHFPVGMTVQSRELANAENSIFRQGTPINWEWWRGLLDETMRNLVRTFGAEEMRDWYFEVWNEPDAWPRDEIETFFKLYDMFAAVVKDHDARFRVGGPGCFNVYFLRDFLDHVLGGTNHVTGKMGAPIDFISYHRYALSGFWLDKSPRIVPLVQSIVTEMLWVQRSLTSAAQTHGNEKLRNVEFHLNEWGQCAHFFRSSLDHPDLVYRDNERAPLFTAKLVDCLLALEDHHAFKTTLMLYWGFNWESKQDRLFIGYRDFMTAGLVPKPMLTGYEFLAKLGRERIAVSGPPAGGRTGLLATRSGESEFQWLCYNFNETDEDLERWDNIEIRLAPLSAGKLRWIAYDLDREHNNTFRTWERMGRPRTAGEADLAALQKAGALTPTSTGETEIADGAATLKLQLLRHSMRLFVARISAE